MPPTSTTPPPTSADHLTPHARLTTLVAALRGQLPAHFKWDFGTVLQETSCGTYGCAMGLAALLWPENAAMLTDPRHDALRAKFFGISTADVERIFWGYRSGQPMREFYRSGNPRRTTVARALEAAGRSTP